MIKSYLQWTPNIDSSVWAAESADIIGQVSIGAESSIWYNTTLRGDVSYIEIGRCTNIQDNCVVHVDDGIPTIIGNHVTVGHGAIVHACTVEDYCLIGMGAIVLDRAHIGRGSTIAAGAVVTPDAVIPPYSLVMGVPGVVVKTLPAEKVDAERLTHSTGYAGIRENHR